jgi:glycosyltransferase involved in cell wall biosynthesis
VTRIAVNGRFITQPLTGVQRVAHELVGHLPGTGADAVLLAPPRRSIPLLPGTVLDAAPDPQWWGGRGHVWEQTTLRRMVRHTGADVLLSPGGWGPLGFRRQVPIIYDLHPILHPEHFVPGFVRWSRFAMPVLARRSAAVIVLSETVRRQLIEHFHADPDGIDVVPPGVGAPFVDRPLDDLHDRAGDECVFVGGDKAQKNLAFVLSFWEEVHRDLGLTLVVTERAVGSRVSVDGADPPGVRRLRDPSDAEMCELLAGALCVLSPSLAEGYNLPLLEGMAVGTPFLATDTGAARELAVEAGQVLPLEPSEWISALRRWRSDDRALSAVRAEGVAVARAMTWERSAGAIRDVVERASSAG